MFNQSSKIKFLYSATAITSWQYFDILAYFISWHIFKPIKIFISWQYFHDIIHNIIHIMYNFHVVPNNNEIKCNIAKNTKVSSDYRKVSVLFLWDFFTWQWHCEHWNNSTLKATKTRGTCCLGRITSDEKQLWLT